MYISVVIDIAYYRMKSVTDHLDGSSNFPRLSIGKIAIFISRYDIFFAPFNLPTYLSMELFYAYRYREPPRDYGHESFSATEVQFGGTWSGEPFSCLASSFF